MKKLGLVLGVAGLLAFISPSVVAQNKQASVTQPKESIEEKAEKQAAKATKEIGLNDEQRSKFKKFASDRLYKITPLKEKMNATADATEKANLKKQIEAINTEYIDRVNLMLTPEQQQKFKVYIEELRSGK